jgi:hypothetical protein
MACTHKPHLHQTTLRCVDRESAEGGAAAAATIGGGGGSQPHNSRGPAVFEGKPNLLLIFIAIAIIDISQIFELLGGAGSPALRSDM